MRRKDLQPSGKEYASEMIGSEGGLGERLAQRAVGPAAGR